MKRLIKRWRGRTKELRKHAAEFSGIDCACDKVAALIYKECADELERYIVNELKR